MAMRSIPSLIIAVLLPLLGSLAALSGARADEREVDLALVLAVDISNSMDPEEQTLQREGFVEAFRSAEVQEAIRKGSLGRIAVVYMEWAGSSLQHVVVPWTVIAGPEDAAAFSDRLARVPTQRAPRTSISGAIDFSVGLLARSGVEAARQVIDVSGDGANNQGRFVGQARDEAVARGITVNGLPIMLKRPGGYFDIEDLDAYYRDCVIGGPGAFMVPVRERRHFADAIRTKLVREIADLGAPLVQPAQAQPRANCFSGESPSWERWRN
jgi:hypothetical protein